MARIFARAVGRGTVAPARPYSTSGQIDGFLTDDLKPRAKWDNFVPPSTVAVTFCIVRHHARQRVKKRYDGLFGADQWHDGRSRRSAHSVRWDDLRQFGFGGRCGDGLRVAGLAF